MNLEDLLEPYAPSLNSKGELCLETIPELDENITLGELRSGKGPKSKKIDPAELGVTLKLIVVDSEDDCVEAFLTVKASKGKEKLTWHQGQAEWE